MTVPTRRPDSDQNSDEKEHDDTPVAYHFVCKYCDGVLETESMDGMYDRGITHLENHRDDLLELFTGNPRQKRCEDDCGYVFSGGVNSADGFECPDCAYDNFDSFARQHLYWGMELVSH